MCEVTELNWEIASPSMFHLYSMIIFKIASELDSWSESRRSENKTIGFAPTMGALHEGHVSLIRESIQHTDITVSSIFINPTQFNNAGDFEKYPVSLEEDIYKLEKAGCDAVLIPSVKEIYPNGMENPEHFNIGDLENKLEGKYRPGHFQGVCQVIKKLLDIIHPHILFLGQKDYQQCLVIQKLLELMKSDTVLKMSSTKREADGLAMSSRNRRLNDQQRKIAPLIFKTLTYVKENITINNPENLKSAASSMLTEAGFKVDYVEIAETENLDTIQSVEKGQNYIAVIAAYLNDIRLIDNMIIKA